MLQPMFYSTFLFAIYSSIPTQLFPEKSYKGHMPDHIFPPPSLGMCVLQSGFTSTLPRELIKIMAPVRQRPDYIA